ncbi:MAG TPA: FISUMP domain-containing protein, partial [Tenuifilaceae bacterium]|nr:FISUMP domain-containing protein [Tenuifilaceae bacterium]
MNLLPNTNKMKFCFVSILMLLLVSAGFSQPIGTITSVAPSPTNQNPIPITVTFNVKVLEFINSDIVISGGTVQNFSTADSIVFTFDLLTASDGQYTVDIPADVCTDVSLNPNVASTQFSVEYDVTSPVINSVTIASDNVNSDYAKVGDNVLLTFVSSEMIVGSSVVINGNIVTPFENLPNEWTATYVATEGDAEGIVPFTIDFTDVAGNTGVTVSTTTDASQVIFDKTPAVLTTVNLASNNANPTYAKVGDVVILSFTSSDSIENVASTIFGNSANINYFGSNNWEATYTTTGSEIEGVAPFAIDFTDVAGNVGATVTATTDASQVTFDNTVPGGYTVSFDQADINATNQTECSFTIDGAEIDATLNYTISSTGGGTDINGSGTITTSSQSFSPIDVSGLGDGTLTLTITLTDLAGNVGVEEFSTVIKYTLSPSLVAYYPFNNNAIDESGNGYNGNPVGPTLVEDRFNNPNSAFNFTGLNDVIDITIDKTLFINGDFTTNSWINISDADFDYIISGDLAHTMVGGGSQTTKSIICHFYNGIDWPTYYSDVDIPVNTWTMVTLIRRGQEIEFYINGKPRGVFTESAIGGVSFISLGGDGSDVNRTLEGMLDDVRIYSYALPEEEITTLYHEGGWDMVADIDGNLYPIVQIGSQEWMGKNLRTAKYSNGETISRVVDNATWTGLTTEAYCWYNNDSTTYSDIYGAIYNWHAANDPRGICPIGWHVPTDAEWTILTNFVGGENIAGNVLKATSGWFDNGNGIDQYGFSALPGGYRESSDGVAYGVGSSGWWWTSTESNATFAWRRAIDFGNISVDRFDVDMKNGFSVRCIKDKEEFAGGTGIPGDPYLVSTADHLYNVRNYPSASFLQVGDIYLNEWPWNQGEGWQPIGDNATPFAGIYDGNGHGIFNLFIDRYDYDYQGLFGFAQNATIKNVNLYDIWIRIQNSGNSHGSLVGYNEASYILNCHAVGYIQGVNHVGGLVGRSTVGGARIEGSSAHLSSNGTGEYIGGLVGFNDNNAVIDSCFSAGDVSATYYGGGLVGWNGGAAYIYNSYSVSNTYGYQVSGGFVGHNDGTIEHSYSAGKISGSTGLGGFTGEDTFMGTISNCFWNTETSQIETSASGTGKVSAEMKTQSTFTGWGFPNPWEILEGETYPYLAWQGGPQDFNYPPVLYTVTFNVDMTGATFDPVNDIVYITGSMFGDPWPEPGTDPVNQEMTRVDATMIWTKTLQIYNGYYGYKYFLNSGWDNSEWGGEPNRNIEIQSDTTFNNSWASLFPDEFAGGSGNASSPLLVETVEQLNNVRNHPDLYFLQIANIDLGVSPWNESEGWLPIGEESNVFSGGYDGNGFVISNLFINRLADYQGLFGYISNANLNSIAV